RAPLPPRTTPFPYTTLFRSRSRRGRSQTGPRAHTVRPYGGKRPQGVGSETAGAEAETHQLQFSSRSGPQWGRMGPRSSTPDFARSEEHTSELQSRFDLVCRL